MFSFSLPSSCWQYHSIDRHHLQQRSFSSMDYQHSQFYRRTIICISSPNRWNTSRSRHHHGWMSSSDFQFLAYRYSAQCQTLWPVGCRRWWLSAFPASFASVLGCIRSFKFHVQHHSLLLCWSTIPPWAQTHDRSVVECLQQTSLLLLSDQLQSTKSASANLCRTICTSIEFHTERIKSSSELLQTPASLRSIASDQLSDRCSIRSRQRISIE